MQKEKVASNKVFDPAPKVFSNAIKFGNLVFTTAKSGTDATGKLGRGIEAQTIQSLDNIKCLLEESGTDMEHVLKTTVYLTSTRNFEKMNEAYSSYFKIPPARAIVITKGWGDKNRLIEIDAIAGLP
jgi:2-iminobutanoate/2-iminopropanoate deaminase